MAVRGHALWRPYWGMQGCPEGGRLAGAALSPLLCPWPTPDPSVQLPLLQASHCLELTSIEERSECTLELFAFFAHLVMYLSLLMQFSNAQ